MCRKWNKQRVIEALQQRHRQGLPMRGVENDDRPLFAAAVRYCGGWHKALTAAGLPSKPKRKWTPELVISTLQAWYRQGLPIHRAWKENVALVQAAQRYFGTWRKAVVAAGIPVPSRRTWTRERVLTTLRAGGSWRMPPRTEDVPTALLGAAYEYFPTWYDALAAAGLVPLEPRPAPRRTWTKHSVLEAIRARHQQGLPLTVTANRALTSAARHRFGRWSNALAAAGLEVRQYRKWSQERVLEHLRFLHEHGAFEKTTRLPDRGLMRAAGIQFGSWRRALRLAGVLAPDENWRHQRSWTRQRVIEAIQDLHVRGIPLNAKKHETLAAAARRRFGSWHAARAAAGLPVSKE